MRLKFNYKRLLFSIWFLASIAFIAVGLTVGGPFAPLLIFGFFSLMFSILGKIYNTKSPISSVSYKRKTQPFSQSRSNSYEHILTRESDTETIYRSPSGIYYYPYFIPPSPLQADDWLHPTTSSKKNSIGNAQQIKKPKEITVESTGKPKLAPRVLCFKA